MTLYLGRYLFAVIALRVLYSVPIGYLPGTRHSISQTSHCHTRESNSNSPRKLPRRYRNRPESREVYPGKVTWLKVRYQYLYIPR